MIKLIKEWFGSVQIWFVLSNIDITQIILKSELLSQIRGWDVVLKDRIHRDSRITQ